MDSLTHHSFFPSIFVFLTLFSCASSVTIEKQFFECLHRKFGSDSGIFNIIFTPTSSSYTSILDSRVQNLRFNTTNTPKPLAIITPLEASHIQATVTCARKHNLQLLIRSMGHDFEGLSYVSPLPFVVLDLINLRNITVDEENKVAWVETGATLGELYYRIAEKSGTLAFPAGLCPTVGVGGHFSGGGFGFLVRKYGLAADNIVDALLVDANGRVLDRASMGEDLFWAIRGGGGNNFGVVISWKVNLVQVPPIVTFFTVAKSFGQNTTKLLNKWQYVASKLPDDIGFFVFFSNDNSTKFAVFTGMYLGGSDSLLSIMEERLPELGLKKEDCSDVSWVRGQMLFAGYPSNSSLDSLLDRTNPALAKFKNTFKTKTDYVQKPLPEAAIESLIKWVSNDNLESVMFFMVAYGGKMGEIAESSIPYPHRAGNLYLLGYEVKWIEQEVAQKHLNWVRKAYAFMAPHVSKNPREAYVNYRDLDIGTNSLSGNTSYKRASIWGTKYFMNNFEKLVRVKTSVDPSNFFRNQQSIPPLSHS